MRNLRLKKLKFGVIFLKLPKIVSWRKVGWAGFFSLLIIIGWQNTLSPPNVQSHISALINPQNQLYSIESQIDYPDSFDFRSEYLRRFFIKRCVVRQGDTLYKVFRKFGLSTECLVHWQKTCDWICHLNQLRPGDKIAIYSRHEDREPVKLVFSPAKGITYVFRRLGDSDKWEFQKKEDKEAIIVTQVAKGTITDNLYDSCLRAGLPPKMIIELADLFACEIDFTTDLRKGNTFSVLFEQKVRDGKRVGAGPILAAEMKVNGQTHQVFYFRQSDGHEGYYDSRRRSIHKFFLKAPLQYSRITSTFTYRRYHPILKIYRPHLGVDYAAPAGTPVSALGDGTITFIGTKGGYGKFIEITHGATAFKTTYGHLSRFAKNLEQGGRVEQGQIIGYVGSTGLSTGPHLDFRFYKNGKPIDFLKKEIPKVQPIPKSLWTEFDKKRQEYMAALQGGRRFALIESQNPPDNE
jgi:murein DD-endopeptidase MepM/ murein hydrolase activator NlpD